MKFIVGFLILADDAAVYQLVRLSDDSNDWIFSQLGQLIPRLFGSNRSSQCDE